MVASRAHHRWGGSSAVAYAQAHRHPCLFHLPTLPYNYTGLGAGHRQHVAVHIRHLRVNSIRRQCYPIVAHRSAISDLYPGLLPSPATLTCNTHYTHNTIICMINTTHRTVSLPFSSYIQTHHACCCHTQHRTTHQHSTHIALTRLSQSFTRIFSPPSPVCTRHITPPAVSEHSGRGRVHGVWL